MYDDLKILSNMSKAPKPPTKQEYDRANKLEKKIDGLGLDFRRNGN